MQFGLSSEQQLLADSVERALAEQVPLERVRAFAANEVPDPREVWSLLTELGVPGVLVPQNLGGIGLGMLDATVIAEALGPGVTPAPYLGSAVMAPTAILLGADEDQQARWLPAIAAGESLVGIAMGEAVGARDGAGIEYANGKLDGTALMVLDFNGADAFLVADSNRAIHRVEADAAGLEHTVLTTIDKTRSVGRLDFNNVDAEMLAKSQSTPALDRTLEAGRIALAADTIGAARTMLDKAVTYAKERKQFNRVIGSFQAVKHMCADIAAQLEPGRAMVWHAAHAFEELPDEAPLLIAHTKSHLSEVGTFTAKTATEVHGGMGYTDLLGLHYWFKRIGVNRQWLGSPEQLRQEAARLQGWIR